jgi:uncharacterized protein YggU (UPF0235/DUF167 family)
VTGDPAFPIAAHRAGSTVDITVSPRSSINALEFDASGALRARVTAPPVAGAANAAVLRLLADALGVPRSRLAILSGDSSRRKRVLVREMTSDVLVRRLETALPKAPSHS